MIVSTTNIVQVIVDGRTSEETPDTKSFNESGVLFTGSFLQTFIPDIQCYLSILGTCFIVYITLSLLVFIVEIAWYFMYVCGHFLDVLVFCPFLLCNVARCFQYFMTMCCLLHCHVRRCCQYFMACVVYHIVMS